MTDEEAQTFHALYSAVHWAHKTIPAIWTDHECNRVLTAIMAAKPFSWRVVGITAAALEKFAEMDFRYRSQQGITRAHLSPRIGTVRALLATDEPLSQREFIDAWLRNDRTVICARGENKASIPNYIPIENEDGLLFSCERRLAGWHHRKAEQDFLRDLYSSRRNRHAGTNKESVKVVGRRTKDSGLMIAKRDKSATHDYLVGAKFIGIDENGGGEFERSNLKFKGKELAERRATHDRVKVLGKEYPSAWKAWQALQLPTSDHQAFRKSLKLKGELTYKYGGKTYRFHIVKR